jgi:hypothetical protein
MKKKIPSRLFILATAFILSLAACGYLNHPARVEIGLSAAIEQVGPLERVEESGDNPLPELHLLEKLIEAARHFIPAN